MPDAPDVDSGDAVVRSLMPAPRSAEPTPLVTDDELPDPEFVDRLVGWDPHDFASLYMRHRASFASLARRYVRNPSDVDEVVQDAFVKLFLALPELESELQAIAYCRRTITNLCIDRYRQTQRRPRLVDIDDVGYDMADDASVEDPLIAAEDAAVVRHALSLLSPLHREALVMREIEEKPLPQIAAALGIEEHNVKHVLNRARRALRRLLVGTAVDPSDHLTTGEIVHLAGRRAMEAAEKPMKVALALILPILMAVGTLTGLNLRSNNDPETPPPSSAQEQPGGVDRRSNEGESPAPAVPSGPAGSGNGSPAGSSAAAGGDSRSSGGAKAGSRPGHSTHKSTKPAKGTPGKPGRPRGLPVPVPPLPGAPVDELPTGFEVTGALKDASALLIAGAVDRSTPGALVHQAATQLVAGDAKTSMMIDQTVTFNGAAIDVALAPTFVIQGQVVQPEVRQMQQTKRQTADLNVVVQTVLAVETPAATDADVPATLSVTMVFTPTLDEIVAEAVHVAAPAGDAGAGTPASMSAPDQLAARPPA